MPVVLSDIASGNTGAADVVFLIAAILFGLAALAHLFTPRGPAAEGRAGYWGWTPAIVDAGLCLVAIGLLLL
jgi:hypothetical protein